MSVIILNDATTVIYKDLEPETEAVLLNVSPGARAAHIRKSEKEFLQNRFRITNKFFGICKNAPFEKS